MAIPTDWLIFCSLGSDPFMPPTTPPANVYLLSPAEVVKDAPAFAEACYDTLRAGFALQPAPRHTLASDPASAEIVLAPIQSGGYGPCLEALRRSAVYRSFADKLVVYSAGDGQFPAVRGLYTTVTGRWAREGWALPAHHISSHIHRFAFAPEELGAKDILFSFVGASRTHPIREKVVRLEHLHAVLIDSSAKTEKHWWEKEDKERFVESFRDVTRRSRFVLCPRGVSASTVRFFEALEAGAVPVIIADDFELPVGPRWEECSIRVPEEEVANIPGLLEGLAKKAGAMGRAARAVWEDYFSPAATVNSFVYWARLLFLHSHRRSTGLIVEEYTRPGLVRAKLRHLLKSGATD
ncbi:MAG TPA: exostosin family protein [Chthoniobacterales bacterium]